MRRIDQDEGGLIFLEAPGGTGKTFLLNLLLAAVRVKKQIALAVASSGIAATLLKGGKTAHSQLKLPLNFDESEEPICNIDKNSSLANTIKKCKLLVWDEATMSHKKTFEACDKSFKDIRNNNKIMGNMVVLLVGDFHQILPVIQGGTPYEEIKACLKSSYLWPKTIKMFLKKNMRVFLNNDQNAQKFSKLLMDIGKGRLPTDENDLIIIPKEFSQAKDTNEMIEKVFPNIKDNYLSDEWIGERVILAPTNEKVNDINYKILQTLPGEEKTFKSIDTVINEDETVNFPTEFLNSINMPGMPQHLLQLKVGASVVLMRNLEAPNLCNGTRLRIISMSEYLICAKVLTGPITGEEVLIPKIPIIPQNVPVEFRRLQFPIRLSFAMTINRSQGQTLKIVGADLTSPCFSHGQFYVICSRISNPKNLYIMSINNKTNNIVYKSVCK